MTTKQAAELYQRAGFAAPADLAAPSLAAPSLAAPSPEHIRNTRRKIVDGIEFRSTLEANAYQILKGWERAGLIENLELQPKYELQPAFRRAVAGFQGCPKGEMVRAITYKSDFRFMRLDQSSGPRISETVVVEAKGHRTQSFELRRKMFLAKYPELRYEIWDRDKVRSLM